LIVKQWRVLSHRMLNKAGMVFTHTETYC